MASRQEWAAAFAEQSASDWRLFKQLLARQDIEFCHALHYLQMACEKIAKAYRCRDTSTALDQVLESHVAASKFIENFLGSPAVRERWGTKPHQRRQVIRQCRQLAREVEKLAPAVARKDHPENAEYPWEVGGQVYVPAKHDYPNLWQLRDRRQLQTLHFVNVIHLAISRFNELALP